MRRRFGHSLRVVASGPGHGNFRPVKIFAGITGGLLLLFGGVIIIAGMVAAGDNSRVTTTGLHGWECEPNQRKQVCEWTGPSPGKMVSPMVQVLAGGAFTLAGSILLAAPVLAGAKQQPAPAAFVPGLPMGPPSMH